MALFECNQSFHGFRGVVTMTGDPVEIDQAEAMKDEMLQFFDPIDEEAEKIFAKWAKKYQRQTKKAKLVDEVVEVDPKAAMMAQSNMELERMKALDGSTPEMPVPIVEPEQTPPESIVQ